MPKLFKNYKERQNKCWKLLPSLRNLPRMYEMCVYIQTYQYFNRVISNWQYDFRRVYVAQHRDNVT